MIKYLILFFYCFLTISYGQKLLFKQFNIEDGLTMSSSSCIVRDNAGYLWIGSQNGLDRYNGGGFEDYKSKKNFTGSIVTGMDVFNDKIYVATTRGLNIIQNDSVVLIDSLNEMKNQYVSCVSVSEDGVVYLGTRRGIWLYNDTEPRLLTPKREYFIRDLEIDKAGVIYGVTKDSVMTIENGNVETEKSSGINTCLYYCHEKGLFRGTDHGLFQLNQKGEWVPYKENLFSQYSIRSILWDSQGALWLGVNSNLGVINYREDKGMKIYNDENGFGNHIVNCIAEDKEENIWFGTSGAGVLQSPYRIFHYYDTEIGLSHRMIWQIKKDWEDRLWVATGNGINIIDDKGVIVDTINEKEGLLSNTIIGLEPDMKNQGMWIGAFNGGLNYYRDGKIKTWRVKDGLSNDYVRKIVSLNDDGVVMATPSGICFYDGKEFHTPPKTLDLDVYYILKLSNDSLLLGTSSGLYHYCGDSVFHKGLDSNLIDLRVLHMEKLFDGRICASAENGFYLLDYENNTFKKFDKSNGMNDSFSYFTQESLDRKIWIGTNRGLHCWDGNRFMIYNRGFGLSADEFNQSSVLRDNKGTIYLGTVNGLNVLKPEFLSGKNTKLNIILSNAIVSGESIINEINPRLPYDKNNIEFNFYGLYLKNPKRVVYHYILEGLDTAWRQSRQREVYYHYLPLGREYCFKIYAETDEIMVSKKVLSFPFSVAPPFWKTYWFAALVVGILFFSSFWKYRNMRYKNLSLEKEVRKRTIEVLEKHERLLSEKKKVEMAHKKLLSMNERLKTASRTDPLTGLPNRRYFIERFDLEKTRVDHSGVPSFCLLMCDLDHFKTVNDDFGHDMGDHVLKEVANLFNMSLRKRDFVCRWGGEEFVIMLNETNLENSKRAAEKLRAIVEKKVFQFKRRQISITLSVGVCDYLEGDSLNQLIKRADKALYQAKNKGRNRVQLYQY